MQERDAVVSLKGVGEKTAQTLKKAGIETVGDLIRTFPARYDRFDAPVRIQDTEGGWTLHGTCHKGGALFRERFLSAAGKSAEEPNAIEDDHREDDPNASN